MIILIYKIFITRISYNYYKGHLFLNWNRRIYMVIIIFALTVTNIYIYII